MQLILFGCLALFSHTVYGQSITVTKINTTSAEAYFVLADILQTGKEPGFTEWQSLFQGIIYQGMIEAKVLDASVFKAAMRRVFSPSPVIVLPDTLTYKEQYHKAYKEHEEKLKKYISLLKSRNVEDSVKVLLYPMLPKRLQAESLFPILYYLNYETGDATGGPHMVINDLLHSYKIDGYKFGLLSAHEAFHSVVSTAFEQSLKTNTDESGVDFSLFYFLENLSEEGIADLIDKPLLLKPASPIVAEVELLTKDDAALAPFYIKKLDSLMSHLLSRGNGIASINNSTDVATNFGQDGGHIPGRFMGNAIKKAGLLQTHLANVENPVSFIITYNAAAKKLGKKYPPFSKESIEYIQQLRAKYCKE